uniref:Vesicle-fusing ATPase n=1 Tax=Plectus sambesii TaxID=2011161 RepID=A0A914WJ20_9BILA
MKVKKCPTDDLAITNCAVVNKDDYDASRIKHVEVKTGPAHRYVFSIKNHPSVRRNEIAFAMPQRKWAALSLDQDVHVAPFNFDPNTQYIGSITLDADFQTKKNQTAEPLNSDLMAKEFSMQFGGQAFTTGELLVFQFADGDKKHTLSLAVKSMEALDLSAISNPEGQHNRKPKELYAGQLLPNSGVVFDKSEGSLLNLVGKSKGKAAFRSIINPDWDFQKMGIGGLDNEFSGIFRRAFASRVFPPEFIEQLGMKHVRGILLFGPPGTGKTLMARQIGKMLNAREPKIVNGPQILDKYVGESEANIRKLFAEAEEEWKRCGANSGLHIIIFDEIDAICKQRGSMAGSTAVHDTVVNQLLSKMDGVDQLNNILVIGMTNRKDMIDEALLRPGRMEVQMEISLPDEAGRLQILKIHTARMREYDKLGQDVDLEDLSKRTKNFSGAEIEGLVRAAQSSAMNRLVKAGGKVQLDPDAVEKLAITVEDFDNALEHDIKPAFGQSEEELNRYLTGGLIIWGQPVHRVLDEGDLLVKQARSPDTRGFVTVLLAGPPNSGKTSLAAKIAKNSEFPFVKLCTPEDMVGFTETAKCNALRKVFDDAYRSPLSVIIVDNIERLLDYAPIGPRYSNLVLQALLVLLKKRPPANRRLLVLATASNRSFLQELDVISAFSTVIDVAPLTTAQEVGTVVDDSQAFSPQEVDQIRQELSKQQRYFIGVKKLLDIIDLAKQSAEGYRKDVLLQRLAEEHASWN